PAEVGNHDPYDAGYDVGAAVNQIGDGSGAPYSEFGEGGLDSGSMRIRDDSSRIGGVSGSQYNTFPSSRNPSNFGAGLPILGHSEHDREPTFSSSIADALGHDPGVSGSEQPPPVPPHQPLVPSGTFAPPSGPPPGPIHQLSESYFSRALPDPNASSSLPAPPAMEQSPWANAPSPSKSRPLPVVQASQAPQPQFEQGGSELAYNQEEASSSPPGAGRRAYGRKNSGEFNYPYSDDAFYVRNHAASSRPLHNDAPSPEPASNHSHEQDQHQIASAAAREVGREMDALAMAPYASSSPRPAPASTYGTPSEFPNALPNPHGGSPLPRPPMGSPAPSLPPLAPIPAISSPPPLSSPTATTRTIPASAFRRNMSRADTLDVGGGTQSSVSPLAVKKKGMGEDTSRGSSPAPISPGAPPLYQPVDPEGTLGAGRERSMSPPLGDRKPSDRGDTTWS
ncbi:hypothetical protein FRC06_005914, partial [Ceratobasidium sp. 370]